MNYVPNLKSAISCIILDLHTYVMTIILSLDKRMQGLANERKRSCESTAIDVHSSMLLNDM